MREGSTALFRFNLRCWYGIDEHADNPYRQQLEQDVLNARLAGIFFASAPSLLQNSPILTHPGIPRVAFGAEEIATRFQQNISVVNVDGASFRERAITRLQERGRRRLAVIAAPIFAPEPGAQAAWTAAAERHGCVLPPWAFHEVALGHMQSGRNLARLLFCEAMSTRPDGLIISDDNLVEHVTLGLADAGVSVPQDLEIVAHCNFPWPPPSALPVTRLGYDAHRIIEEGLRLLRESIAGAPPVTARLDAVFEEEVEKAAALENSGQ